MTDTVWPSTPPADCPFEPSDAISEVAFTGQHREYTGADTWYPSWGADDVLYSPWTDGNFDWPIEKGWDITNFQCSSDSRNPTNGGTGKTGTGQARLLGSDPLTLQIENLGIHYTPSAPYGGRYPCGSLMHNGVWYYGTYCLDETNRKEPVTDLRPRHRRDTRNRKQGRGGGHLKPVAAPPNDVRRCTDHRNHRTPGERQ